jgi:hypothetical protein
MVEDVMKVAVIKRLAEVVIKTRPWSEWLSNTIRAAGPIPAAPSEAKTKPNTMPAIPRAIVRIVEGFKPLLLLVVASELTSSEEAIIKRERMMPATDRHEKHRSV